MTRQDDAPRSSEEESSPPQKRPYAPPKLEKLGTYRQIALGLGANKFFDGGHPPGQNKSRL